MCLFHAQLECGIYAVPPQVYACLADEGTVSVQMGPKTESRGILSDSHVSRDIFHFCNVWVAIFQYVCANAILFVAEGIQSRQGIWVLQGPRGAHNAALCDGSAVMSWLTEPRLSAFVKS